MILLLQILLLTVTRKRPLEIQQRAIRQRANHQAPQTLPQGLPRKVQVVAQVEVQISKAEPLLRFAEPVQFNL